MKTEEPLTAGTGIIVTYLESAYLKGPNVMISAHHAIGHYVPLSQIESVYVSLSQIKSNNKNKSDKLKKVR